ncbi:MAG: circularly permuted type 2 ATP-grasp protein [Acutalibacteraceae bacterium]|nr:circularly permuted type 2 ATP-grasp protein [Acutalibacteraceae bacterium]
MGERDLSALIENRETINKQLQRYGVKFGIYKNGNFEERFFPFDPVPRIITHSDYEKLEKGLTQRVTALNAFLADIYGEGHIVKDGIVPESFVYGSPGYLAQCEGLKPPKGIFAHIAGIDLVQADDGSWVILEDNLRIPSGASYPLIARHLCRRCSPITFKNNRIMDNRNYGVLLKQTMDNVNTGGINVIFTPGRYNAAYFEHSYLAEQSGAVLAETGDLFVDGNKVYYRGQNGPVRVGAIYRRVSDDFLDPLCFRPESLIGIPNIMSALRAGNVGLLNTPGNGVADDKGIYYFVPKMIRYYLNEEPILQNAPTYLPYYEDDRNYTIEHLDDLVIKDVAEAGGYGVRFGRDLTQEQKKEMVARIEKEPRRFISQEIINFQDLPIIQDGKMVNRKADLRAFVLTADKVHVWPSGLTRFTTDPESFVVNSSQGGGFKDTWVTIT